VWLIPSSIRSRFAPESEDSSSASRPPSHPVFWVTSSGTPTPRPSSWRGWRTRPWSRLLFGAATSPTSTQLRSWVESISCRLDSPASPGALQESGRARTTSAGSGPPSSGSSASASPATSSSRTFRDSIAMDSVSCFPTLPRSGSMRSGRISQRPTWERRTCESGSSFWATPNARDHKGQDLASRQGGDSLPAQVRRMAGATTSELAVLSPRFVEALQGFPPGWTAFDALETPSSRNRPSSPSGSSGVESMVEAGA
jgi:hypothetical protein